MQKFCAVSLTPQPEILRCVHGDTVFCVSDRLEETENIFTVFVDPVSVRMTAGVPAYGDELCGITFSASCTFPDSADPAGENVIYVPECSTDPRLRSAAEVLLRGAVFRCGGLPREFCVLQLRNCLNDMLLLLAADPSRHKKMKKTGRQDDCYCELACSYIAEHVANRVKVEDVASSIGVSYRHLSRLFSQYMGMTLVDYINREKIRFAQRLLLERERSLEEVGAAIGIDDTKYLSRLFRRYTGMTVTEYRKCRKAVERIYG